MLRGPFLDIFSSLYSNDSKFPNHLKDETPPADQKSKIRTQPPCDDDVITYLTDAFPDLYMKMDSFQEGDVLCGETLSGRGAADKEEVTVNVKLVLGSTKISGMELSVLFIAVFLHELGHSFLVWYGKRCLQHPKAGWC
jgi:hypothetical protein